MAMAVARSAAFSRLPVRISPIPITTRCYSGSSLIRCIAITSEYHNHFESSGSDRMGLWLPFFLSLKVQPGTVAVTERFGEFRKILYPGKHWLVPVIDKVASLHATEELDYPLQYFWCMTKDKANVSIRGFLGCKVVEPMLASYKVAAPIYATLRLAEHVIISAMGKITLSKFLTEKDNFIDNLLSSINAVSTGWGIECTRFEINNLSFPVHNLKMSDLFWNPPGGSRQ